MREGRYGVRGSLVARLYLMYVCRVIHASRAVQNTIATASPTGGPMDLRKSNRYAVSAPAFFCWENPDGKLAGRPGNDKGHQHHRCLCRRRVCSLTRLAHRARCLLAFGEW